MRRGFGAPGREPGRRPPLYPLARRPAAWTPANLPGLALWLKADAGVFTDPGKTTPATAAGDPVACWADQSGQARDATQPTAGDRPTLAAGVLNGLPAVAFDGTGSALASTFGATLPQPLTIAIVFDIVSHASPQQVFGGVDLTTSNALYHDQGVYAAIAGTEMGASGHGEAVPLPAPFVILTLTFDGADSQIRRNGAPYSAGDAGTQAADSLTIGDRTDGQFPYGGRVGELIVCHARLDGGDVARVEAYLNARYQLF